MKRLIPLLLALVFMQYASAQKTGIDSLQVMPEKLFTKGNVLNCSVQGYRKTYVYRFKISGNAKPFKACLRHEMSRGTDYPGKLEQEVFNKRWYESEDVAAYLQDWTFEIVPSTDSFSFGDWAEGVNPNGATDLMYVHLPGGNFSIVKGMDTTAFRHWKLFIGQKTLTYDTAWIDRQFLPVNNDPSSRQDVDSPRNQVTLTVYNFSNQTQLMGIARWGNLFFPFYYGYRKNERPQFMLSSIQVGF